MTAFYRPHRKTMNPEPFEMSDDYGDRLTLAVDGSGRGPYAVAKCIRVVLSDKKRPLACTLLTREQLAELGAWIDAVLGTTNGKA
jgi:hypothetical protein